MFCELFRLCTALGEVLKINHQISLRYISIDSYAYHKLILLILQIIILYIGKPTPFYYILRGLWGQILQYHFSSSRSIFLITLLAVKRHMSEDGSLSNFKNIYLPY